MDAIEQARELLERRRGELVHELTRLTEMKHELERVETALGALGAPPKRSLGQRVSEALDAVSEHMSVRAAVQRVLDDEPRAWSPSELETEFTRRGFNLAATNVRPAIRSAVWTLRNSGKVIDADDGRVISAKWSNDEDPAEAGPSLAVAQGGSAEEADPHREEVTELDGDHARDHHPASQSG